MVWGRNIYDTAQQVLAKVKSLYFQPGGGDDVAVKHKKDGKGGAMYRKEKTPSEESGRIILRHIALL